MAHTFHLFPTLPQELRLAIWNYILQEPRNVTVRQRTTRYDYDPITFRQKARYFHPCDPPPPALHVCSESRYEALKVYTRAFAHGTAPRYTYINFQLDRLIIQDYDLYDLPASEHKEAILKLVLIIGDFDVFRGVFFGGERGGRNLKTLVKFTAVIHDEWEETSIAELEHQETLIRGYFEAGPGDPEAWVSPKVNFVMFGDEGGFGAKFMESGDF